jgi:DNA (cytosine-5)-methyltransferase 1
LFCGAGGAGKGYADAGFEVVGVDINPQPNYPFEFHEADAIGFMTDLLGNSNGIVFPFSGERIDAIHASPPCPRYSSITPAEARDKHPDLVGPVREALQAIGLPYVIENVPGAPMENPIQICGSGLNLRVRRHRLFEVSFPCFGVPCAHGLQASNHNRIRSGYVPPENSVVPVYGGGQAGFDIATCREAMGIPWMTTDELNDAIPPAYTEHIGNYLLAEISAREVAA